MNNEVYPYVVWTNAFDVQAKNHWSDLPLIA